VVDHQIAMVFGGKGRSIKIAAFKLRIKADLKVFA